jgi:hypothetical protein
MLEIEYKIHNNNLLSYVGKQQGQARICTMQSPLFPHIKAIGLVVFHA